MNKLFYGVLGLMIVGIVSCETDIDVNADPTDITVVYGLIDPEDTTHYVKINKAFIGEGSALDLAADADNFNYTASELNVRLEGNGKNYSLTRVTNEVPKDAGIFDNSTNVLYKFTEEEINRNATYTLTIVNTQLEKEITATTSIVSPSSIEAPRVFNTLALWSGNVSSGNPVSDPLTVSVGANVGRIQAYLVFNYTEYYTIASGLDSVSKKVLLNLGEKKAANASNNQLTFLIEGQSFFDNLIRKVALPSTITHFSHREMENISFELSVAGSELSTYMEAQAPSTTVNQDKPSYTNIDNGIGIFSSRTYDTSWKSNKTKSSGLNINTDTKRKLGSLGLGFCLGTNSTATVPCPY